MGAAVTAAALPLANRMAETEAMEEWAAMPLSCHTSQIVISRILRQMAKMARMAITGVLLFVRMDGTGPTARVVTVTEVTVQTGAPPPVARVEMATTVATEANLVVMAAMAETAGKAVMGTGDTAEEAARVVTVVSRPDPAEAMVEMEAMGRLALEERAARAVTVGMHGTRLDK